MKGEEQTQTNSESKVIKEFPFNALPEIMKKVIIETTEEYDANYMLAGMIVYASLAIGNNFGIRLRQNWYEKDNLQVAIIGPQSSVNHQ